MGILKIWNLFVKSRHVFHNLYGLCFMNFLHVLILIDYVFCG
ncbi:hypothetical protein Leryth_024361 [Lithospermum erythrorhizon]|nr:hypothetical protein Leryth_024361 [Lithospermum erythrorhizon]